MSGWKIRKPESTEERTSITRRQSRNSFLANTRPVEPDSTVPLVSEGSDEESEEEILLDVNPARVHSSPALPRHDPASDEEHASPAPPESSTISSPTGFLRSVPVESVYSQASFKRPTPSELEHTEGNSHDDAGDSSYPLDETALTSSEEEYKIGFEGESSDRSPSPWETLHQEESIPPRRGSASFSLGQRRRDPSSLPTSPTPTTAPSPTSKLTRPQQLVLDEDEHHSEGDFRTLRSSADFLALSQGAGSPLDTGSSQSQSVRSFRTLLTAHPSTGKMNREAMDQARYEKLFLRYFQLGHDRFVEHTLCAYQQATTMRGRLYVSDRHLCFHSKFYRRVIPMQEIQYIKKSYSAYIFDDGITLISRDGKRHVFSGLPHRDELFTRLQALLPSSVTALPSSDRSSRGTNDILSILSRPSLSTSASRSQDSSPLREMSDLYESSSSGLGEKSGKDKAHSHQRSLSQSDTRTSTHEAGEKPPLTRRLSATFQQTTDRFKQALHHQPTPSPPPPASPPVVPTQTLALELVAQRTPMDEDLAANFHLPKEERVLEVCHCAMRRNGRYQPGRLYVTAHYLCFRTLEWVAGGWAPQFFQTTLENVEDIRPENMAQVFPLGLRVRVKPSASSSTSESHRFGWISQPSRVCEALRMAVKRFHEIDRTQAFLSRKASEIFQQYFTQAHMIPEDERMLLSSPCVQRDDSVCRAGHLFLTENLVGWYVMNAVSHRQEILPFRVIRHVSRGPPSKTSGGRSEDDELSHSLILYTIHGSYHLEGIPHADQWIAMMTQQRTAHASSSSPTWEAMCLSLHPNAKQQVCQAGAYQWVANNYLIRMDPPSHYQPAEWETSVFYGLPDDSHTCSIQWHVPWLTCSLPYYTTVESLRFQAEQLARHSTRSDYMKLVDSRRVEKATAFPGSWEGWMAHVCDETDRHTIVLYGRYQDYPPLGEWSQDVVITWRQHFPSQSYPIQNSEELEEQVLPIWTSMQPQQQYQYDKNTLRYRLESLSCDYNGYHWAHQHPRFIPPELVEWANQFAQCLLRPLGEVGMLPPGVELPSLDTPHPLRYLRDVCSYSERQCKNDNEWTARVCYYFSWVGHHHAPGLSWPLLLQAAQHSATIRDVVDYLLHFRRVGKKHNTFIGTSLGSKVEDEAFMEAFTFNERFAYLLLQEHYFRYFLEDQELIPWYATLLVSMLRNAVTSELVVALCQEMAWWAGKSEGRVQFSQVDGLIGWLYPLLSSPSELIVVEAARALMNILHENTKAKEQLLQCGFLPYCRSRLLPSPYQYAPHTLAALLSLYRTTICTQALRTQLTQENALVLVSGLLNRRSLFENDQTFTAILSVLWRLVTEENRSLLCQGRVMDRIAERLLKSDQEFQVEVLRVSLGTLVALCCGNEYNCIKVSQLGFIPWLAEICSTWEDSLLITRGLLLLLCICQYEESRELLLDERLMPVVSCWAQYGTTQEICAIAGQVYVQLYAGQ